MHMHLYLYGNSGKSHPPNPSKPIKTIKTCTHTHQNPYPWWWVWVLVGMSKGCSEKPMGYPLQSLTVCQLSNFQLLWWKKPIIAFAIFIWFVAEALYCMYLCIYYCLSPANKQKCCTSFVHGITDTDVQPPPSHLPHCLPISTTTFHCQPLLCHVSFHKDATRGGNPFSVVFLSTQTKGGPGRESHTEGRLVSSLRNPLTNFFFGMSHDICITLAHHFHITNPVVTAKCSVQARASFLLPFPVGKICNNILRRCSHYLA